MTYLNVNDPLFDQEITLRETLQVLTKFVEQYHARGESSTASLMSDIGISASGETCDPAQIYDFLRVAGEVLNDERLISASQST